MIITSYSKRISFSPKSRTLLLRVTTRTPLIGLGRAPPGTSLHSPTEGRYTSVETRTPGPQTPGPRNQNCHRPPVTRSTCKNHLKGLFIQDHIILYPFIILGNITGASMPKSSNSESRAEVLYPPLLAISGHSGGSVESSSYQHCVCFRVWY